MDIALLGSGKMGKMVERMAMESGDRIVPPDMAEVFIEFSHPSCVLDNVKKVALMQKPHIIGTTGWDEHVPEAKKIVSEAKSAALFAPNFSIGVLLFMQLLKEASKLFATYDKAGFEIHHKEKKDAPSGTAIAIERLFDESFRFSSLRVGEVPGTHEVLLDSPSDTVTLTHTAKGREGFARGAIQAAHWLKNKKGWYTIDDYIRSLYSARHSV